MEDRSSRVLFETAMKKLNCGQRMSLQDSGEPVSDLRRKGR